ncbi:MAG: hypothetical protein P8Z37_17345 [Acidobacteriota bacterium]
MRRSHAIQELMGMITGIHLDHPVRVGIDGVDCSGKTNLANELADSLKSTGRQVIRASIDGFHNPSSMRQKQGQYSPKGYYEDSFDLDSLLKCLLLPLGSNGSRLCQTSCFDFRVNRPTDSLKIRASATAILVFEGVFLHKPELIEYWDFTIFMDSCFETTLRRALKRDLYLFSSEEEIQKRYCERYIPGQRIYLELCNPAERADVVFQNDEIDSPSLIKRKVLKH